MSPNCTEKTRDKTFFVNTCFRQHKKVAGVTKAVLAFSILLFSCTTNNNESKAQVKSSSKNSLPLVELFTSEGCSSCPPADRLLSKIKEENNAIVLGYHVDYWDRLGWKDPFSQAAFSDRQRQYAKHFSLESIYTPQAVVNGAEELVGSNEGKLRAALQTNPGINTAIEVTATRKSKETAQVSYKLTFDSSVWLQVALVQPEATTAVKRGENNGLSLHHVNVVRSLQTIEPQQAGVIEIRLPDDLQTALPRVILFAQQKKSFAITGATELVVPALQSN